MAQLGVVSLYTLRLALALCHRVRSRIQKLGIDRKAIAEVAMGGRRIIDDLLHGFPVPSPGDPEAQNAARASVHTGQQVGWLFLRLLFWETNVKSSSSSRVSSEASFWRTFGSGGAGRLAAAWLTQLMMV